MDDKFFMIYGEGQRAPTVKHHNYEVAAREAERLCRVNPGIEFYVMMPVSVSKRVDVETRKLVNMDDGIPF